MFKMNKDNSPERQHDSGMITGKMCFINSHLIVTRVALQILISGLGQHTDVPISIIDIV